MVIPITAAIAAMLAWVLLLGAQSINSLIFLFLIAALQVVIFGLPVIFFLLWRKTSTVTIPLLVGGLVGAVPWVILMLMPGATIATSGSEVTVLGGHYTWAGWMNFARLTFTLFFVGAISGLIVWVLILRKTKSSRHPQNLAP